MALRGDFQGGSIGGASSPGGFSSNGEPIAIEKYLKWSWGFFGGALLTTVTALGTIIYWLSHFTFAPATFFFEIAMLLFGLMMLVLDTPIPHMQNHKHIQAARVHIYKFALFMTRFLGRGLWYLFLATMVFASLWDTGINWFLGCACTAYLTILGIAAVGKGIMMTNKLNKVHDILVHDKGLTAERLIPGGHTGLSAEQFKAMIGLHCGPDMLKQDEIEYAINALAFTPFHDGKVTIEELRYWLMPGPPMMV